MQKVAFHFCQKRTFPYTSLIKPNELSYMYVNDIPDLVNSKIKMFADDIKIYTQITSFSDALSFQNDLDKLCGWARDGYCTLILLSVNT